MVENLEICILCKSGSLDAAVNNFGGSICNEQYQILSNMASSDDDYEITLSMVIPSSFSLFGSFLVCLTYFVFQDLRRLRYVELVFYMSLNDMIASIGSVMGVVHSEACTFQGIVTNMNFLSSILWCVVVTYQLWLVVTSGKMITNSEMRMFHLICWVFPAIITLLPFINTTYGHDNGNTWCFVSETSSSPDWAVTFWSLFSFYLWVLIAIAIMVLLMLDLFIKVRSMPHTSNIVSNSLKKLVFYPIVFIVCWIPSYVSDSAYSQHSADDRSTNVSGSLLPCLQGFFLSITFFYQNIVVRKKWKDLITSLMITTPESRDSLVSSVVLIESEIDYIRPSERSTEIFVNKPAGTVRDWLFTSHKSNNGSVTGSVAGISSHSYIGDVYRDSHRSQFDSGTSGNNSSIEL